MVTRRLGSAISILGILMLGTVAARTARAVDADSAVGMAPSALEPFSALIGGAWHFDGSYQVFEWGVGRELVRARSYRILDGEAVLVAEGSWFWHPGQNTIRGFSSAIQMPVSLFEYVTSIEGTEFSHRLTAYGDMGGSFRERWELVDPDHYEWRLHSDGDAEGSPMMSGTFERVAWPVE